MAFASSGNNSRHHDYKVCPNCGKKGVYTPLKEVLRNNKIAIYPKQCKYCNEKFGKMRFETIKK
jgi:hypothetical protein